MIIYLNEIQFIITSTIKMLKKLNLLKEQLKLTESIYYNIKKMTAAMMVFSINVNFKFFLMKWVLLYDFKVQSVSGMS